MTSKKNSSKKRRTINPVLSAIFKMNSDQLVSIKRTGGGVHKSGPKHRTRGVQKRQAVSDGIED
jgi:hypothetical protein